MPHALPENECTRIRLPRLIESAEVRALPAGGYRLVLLPAGTDWHAAPGHERVEAVLKRQGKEAQSLSKTPLCIDTEHAGLEAWLRLDARASVFERHTRLRQAVKLLLEENPQTLSIAVFGDAGFRAQAAADAVYVTLHNAIRMPAWQREKPPRRLQSLSLEGHVSPDRQAFARAWAEGNALARCLTRLPPNRLRPASYRALLRVLAKREGWTIEEYEFARLQKMQAGAFLAVARGSGHEDAAIVRLGYAPSKKAKGETIALVGKGICFDTGGHNLKPARYMHNMHDDMNGSAVALGILLAASRLRLPQAIEAWLAIAENHLSPRAYTQNEVVRALDGTTIEVVHTDAEGRMVLADTLALAAREKPAAILDFATLTGSMTVALGERMSGVFANREALASRAVAAGEASGERVVAFPMPADYDEALKSAVADVKQCILEGEADHILAARFLSRFVRDIPWLHVDLSASRCKGGLGAADDELTGFGVGLGLALLRDGLADNSA